MHNATVYSFPQLPAFSSGRAWTIVAIVLLHAVLVWALTNSLARQTVQPVPKPLSARFLPDDMTPSDPPPPPPRDPRIIESIPTDMPLPNLPASPGAISTVATPTPTGPELRVAPPPEPVIVLPQIPAGGLSAPAYPSQEIRMGHTGTVMISVLIQADGRVGEVRLERSSGYARLDQAAITEAHRWQFTPGTRDGVPVAMWKQMPVTFRLE